MNPKGKLLIIGGHEDRADNEVEIRDNNHEFSPNEILKLLVTSKKDRIEVITAGSSEPESMRDTYQKTFTEIGYTNFGFYIRLMSRCLLTFIWKEYQNQKQYSLQAVIRIIYADICRTQRFAVYLKKNIRKTKILSLPAPARERCTCLKSLSAMQRTERQYWKMI